MIITRRRFTRTILALPVVPVLRGNDRAAGQFAVAVPDTIAGHPLTTEEQNLAARFGASIGTSYEAMRQIPVDYTTAPAIGFVVTRKSPDQ